MAATMKTQRADKIPEEVTCDELDLLNFLEDEIWPQVPSELLGRQLSKVEEGAILGYDTDGT